MTYRFYHRRSIRLPGYDYSSPGIYFITMCVQNREYLFGKIKNGHMVLNEYGTIVSQWWQRIPKRYNNVHIDKFIVMPNHVHGIIMINPPVGAGSSRPWSSRPWSSRPNPISGRGNPAPTLGKIVTFFKYQTTKKFNELRNVGIQKLWQRNYYEHIIRNNKKLENIRKYIQDNPEHWKHDCFYEN